MNDDYMICPSLSYGKPDLVICCREKCPFYNVRYGCLYAYETLCNIEHWEMEKGLSKNEAKLKAQSDIAIY